jgi:hypothetical protein
MKAYTIMHEHLLALTAAAIRTRAISWIDPPARSGSARRLHTYGNKSSSCYLSLAFKLRASKQAELKPEVLQKKPAKFKTVADVYSILRSIHVEPRAQPPSPPLLRQGAADVGSKKPAAAAVNGQGKEWVKKSEDLLTNLKASSQAS